MSGDRDAKPSPREERTRRTRELILDAALDEFAERGFEGARIERVAETSGRNKALIYRHFGDKRGLFEASLAQAFRRRDEVRRRSPKSMADALVYWFRNNADDAAFFRVVMQEALASTGETETVEREFRSEFYDRQVRAVARSMGSDGESDEDAYRFLALMALTAFPWMFPQLVELVTGQQTSSRRFKKGWSAFLAAVGEDLAPAEETDIPPDP